MRRFFNILGVLFAVHLSCSYGQVINIDIDARQNHELQLTDIAENVTSVVFEIHPDYKFGSITEFVWANPYCFLHVQTWQGPRCISDNILQYTTSGKFVRSIGLKGGNNYFRNITCDTINHKLYLSKNDTLLVYDFDGKLMHKHGSFAGSSSYFLHENFIWAQYMALSDDRTTVNYTFSRFDPRNMSEQKIYLFNDKDGVIDGRMAIGSSATYSTFKNDLYVSFGIDNLIHQMQKQTLIPAFKINITPESPDIHNPKSSAFHDRIMPGFRGFIGSYLFINYAIEGKRKLYIYDTKTKKGYNFSHDDTLNNQGIRDNIYGSGHITLSKLNRSGYFYYIRNAGALKEMPKGVTDKSQPVVFIAKIKE